MGSAYLTFGVALAFVAVVGLIGVPERLGIGDRSVNQQGTLFAIITAIAASGLLSLSFLADKLVTAESRRLLLEPGDLSISAVMVLWLLLVCLAGLLCALVGLVILNADTARRWAGGCLAVSSLVAVVSSPAVIALILYASDAATAAGIG